MIRKKAVIPSSLSKMSRGKLTILLFLFVLLSFFSILALYSTYQLPTEEEVVTPIYAYEERGTYDYTARLKPNTIYDNRSTLKPGQGSLYTQIMDSIDTSFTYTFKGDCPADITIEYGIDVSLESSVWRKNFNQIPIDTQKSMGSTAQVSTSFSFDIDSIEALRSTLATETRSGSRDYNVTIRPQISTTTVIKVGNQTQTITLTPFTPTLTYTFRYDQISPSALEYTRSGERTNTVRFHLPGVIQQQYFTYGFSAFSFAGLAITSLVFRQTGSSPKTPVKKMEEIVSPFQEVIAESSGEPIHEGQITIITMNSLEDLIKVADLLGKPVLAHQKLGSSEDSMFTRVFYILDGTTRYECIISAPSVTEKEKRGDETE